MIARRALLGLIGGSAVAGPSIGREAVKGLMGQAHSGPMESMECAPTIPQGVPSYRVHERLFSIRRQIQHDVALKIGCPSIITKRSWSLAFKAHCLEQDAKFEREVMDRLEADAGFREKLTAALGLSN